ncbi:MAG TPA: hypothetical protein VJ927_03665 [Actinomycetota bacterium]|nr:hypothetical protein [Actinomycetota bacterium]
MQTLDERTAFDLQQARPIHSLRPARGACPSAIVTSFSSDMLHLLGLVI